MKKKKVRKSGVHVITHPGPTFGLEIALRINSVIYSIIIIQRDLSLPLLLIYFWIGMIITVAKIIETSQSINTCFVIEKSIPNIFGIWIIGCEISELEKNNYPGAIVDHNIQQRLFKDLYAQIWSSFIQFFRIIFKFSDT